MSRCRSILLWPPALPLPATQGEQQQGEQVSGQQQQVEGAAQEQPLGQEAPVHRPLEHELAAQVEGPVHVAQGVLHQEGQAQQQLWWESRWMVR